MVITHMAISYSDLAEVHPHHHEDWEIVLNLRGTGTNLMDGHTTRFEPGTITLCPQGMVHHKKADSSGFQDIYATIKDPLGLSGTGPSILKDDAAQTMRSLMKTAHLYHQFGTLESAAIVHSLFEAICGILMTKIHTSGEEACVTMVKHEIIQRFSDPEFRLDEAMSAPHFCKDHIRRRFKKSQGMTPMAYLTHLRIEQARTLLQSPSGKRLSITEIAYICGFTDAGYFGQIFKKHTSQTPVHFRRHSSPPHAQ